MFVSGPAVTIRPPFGWRANAVTARSISRASPTRQMDEGGREALLHYLLNRDLADFNVRLVPQTRALAEQKAHSRRGVERLVETIAHNGMLPWAHPNYPDIAI